MTLLRRLLPRSLPGQLALLVAIALFVAQAINFAMILRERSRFRLVAATTPAVTRLVDAIERIDSGRPLPQARPRGRVQLVAADPVPAGLVAVPEVEAAVRTALGEAGVRVGRITSGIRTAQPDRRRTVALNADGTALDRRGYRRVGEEVLLGVERPGRGWLALAVPWPRAGRTLIAQLIAQTLVLYGIVLLAVLWIGHRIARPLRTLAGAAREFRPGHGTIPVEERGPSDVRAVIAAYNALSTRVTAMLDEKDRMLGAIGHDLRTPLAALRVRIESVEDDGDRAKMADTIDEMTRTLEDILSLARLGRPSEAPVEVDLAALVDAVVEDFRDLDHQVSFEEAERLPLRLRPALMRRAVRNLVENAVKYAGAAEVRLVRDTARVRIEVLDRGPGIPGDKLGAVFDPFTRVETSRNRETGGIGLGLALTRAIVEDAGGSITLVNRDGGGLVAAITLPRS